MVTQTRPPEDLSRDLMQFLADYQGAQEDLARKAGVHQSTVSRIKGGETRVRLSKGLRKLCKYAKIKIETEIPASPQDPTGNTDLMSALAEVWDGTAAHAKALARLIRDTKHLSPGRNSR